ncbi:MAG TPA: DUF4388 domain-containing protein [Thermoanaerobaculia bacterium]|nr:DUF4388 domain-containing protein [Thermoanaerobaculia bacterium]
MDFSGRLAAFPMSDLLQWAKNERRTGALVVRRSAREKRIYLDRGDVVGCLSDDPAEFYGQHLLIYGHLTEPQLFQTLTHCTQQKVRLGAALRELGILPDEVIQRTLREQIEDTIWDMFLWPRGLFYFQEEMLPEEDLLPEPIDTMGLILEGTRWIDEMDRIRRVLIHDGVVIRRGAQWPGTDLPPLDRRVARAVDGQTVGDLYRKVRGSYFRFLESVYRLCIASVLDIQDVGEETLAGTFEMSVYDLLLEQATEDQILVARKHMAVPLDLLERCCPVWVGEPSAEEQKRMPARARDFYARLDGRTSLGEAFSGDARQRARELDLLLLQLQKGRLALLPVPLDRLEKQAEESGVPPLQRWWKRVFG